MASERFITRLRRFGRRLNGSTIEYDLTPYESILREVRRREDANTHMSDRELEAASAELIEKARRGMSPDDMIAGAYALVCEAARRTLGLDPFDVQVLGGIALHGGKIAEMKTGEGKTLAAVFPVYLNALAGAGVHVLTFNDYLARRDAEWMGPVYRFLGLTVGCVQESMAPSLRRDAYAADITYLTAKEAGFDYLRDCLCRAPEDRVHRPFNFAIVDEADSILVDEARIPLVIAADRGGGARDERRFAEVAEQLEPGVDVGFGEGGRNVYLTEAGLERAEAILGCDDLYAADAIDTLTRLSCALHAEFLLRRDVDYIVRSGAIELVDEFTGRVADRRRWPDGLQAALEAKERISVRTRGTTLNSITLQHFLGLYPRLGGMTATAQSAETEFERFYGLDIVVIPPNRRCIRIDHEDSVYRTRAEKQAALLREIASARDTGRPVLVGTGSVEESAVLAAAIRERGVECAVLNAKNDEAEAEIVAGAGSPGAVTISTNMAGRGTDIRLGGPDEKERERVTSFGGLYVIGTNKHESGRIDDQLRGRAGRQGDPGSSRFIVSLEDDLFVKNGLEDLFPASVLGDSGPGELESDFVRREIGRVQRIIEGQNLEIKKTLFGYSSFIEQQRRIMLDLREHYLDRRAAATFFEERAPEPFREAGEALGEEKLGLLCGRIGLACLDSAWSEHLAEVSELRERIHLHGIGGQEPLHAFQKEVVAMFDGLLGGFEDRAIRLFGEIGAEHGACEDAEDVLKPPSATWTYLVSDNPFEELLGLQKLGGISLSVEAAFLIMLLLVVKRLKRRFRKRTKSDTVAR